MSTHRRPYKAFRGRAPPAEAPAVCTALWKAFAQSGTLDTTLSDATDGFGALAVRLGSGAVDDAKAQQSRAVLASSMVLAWHFPTRFFGDTVENPQDAELDLGEATPQQSPACSSPVEVSVQGKCLAVPSAVRGAASAALVAECGTANLGAKWCAQMLGTFKKLFCSTFFSHLLPHIPQSAPKCPKLIN